ncbi:MAG: transporter [Gammaproteobacteria bacterium]|nr:transporter [Gammaproteobacteria bacterium]
MIRRIIGYGMVPATMLAATASMAQESAVNNVAYRHSSALAVFYSKGFYGLDLPTYVRYVPYTHELGIPGWRFKASLPVLEIDGPGNVLIDVGNIGRESDSGRVAARGVGDLVLSATYEMPALGTHLPFFDITLDVKLPTADERRGLGTGRPDLGIQIDAYQNIGSFTLFGAVGYRYRHRSPVFEGLNDSFSLSLGSSRGISERWQAGVIYDFRQAASSFSGETHEILPYISWAATEQLTFMFYTIKGFTVDSADRAVGIQMTRRW